MDIELELETFKTCLKELVKISADTVVGWKEHAQETTQRLKNTLIKSSTETENNVIHLDKTPKQINKRTKRLSPLIDTDIEIESLRFSPQCNPPKNIDLSGIRNSRRPQRAAKLNIDFKEEALNKKKRRPSNFNNNNNTINQTLIKQERLDKTISKIQNNSTIKQTKITSKKSKELTDQEDAVNEPMDISSYENVPTEEHQNNQKQHEESILILQNSQEKIVEILESDENDIFVIPPPPAQALPKKKNRRNRKQSTRSNASAESIELITVKNEKKSLETNKPTNQNEAAENQNTLQVNVKEEKLSITSTTSTTSTNSKPKKGKKRIVKPIKVERFSDEIPEPTGRVTRARAEVIEKNKSIESVYEDAVPEIISVQTINTDIVQSNCTNKITDIKILSTPVVRIVKLASEPAMLKANNQLNINENLLKTASLPNPVDATFVSPNEECHSTHLPVPTTECNETYVTTKSPTPECNETYVTTKSPIPECNETYITTPSPLAQESVAVGSNKVNETVCISNETIQTTTNNNDETFKVPPHQQKDNNSLITDDDSDLDVPLVNKALSKITKHELFNPCIQSPVKQKVEAFEKQALNSIVAQSPAQRQTRTKTRAKQKKALENIEPNTENEMNQQKLTKETKNITPLIGRQISKLLTPAQYSNITPIIGSGAIKKLPSSTSKLIGIHKTLQSAKSSSVLTTSRTPNLSRESSTEDMNAGYLKNKEIAEERRKKREQKQQQAALVREAKERERLKKIMDEREEKARRKRALEAEQKRILEENQRQLKLQEERQQQMKLEKAKQLEREKAEIARKEQEMLENIKIQKAKEQLQLKLQKNKKAIHDSKILKKQNKQSPSYDFEMLRSDDSTDDEDKVSTKRPALPSWSRKGVRELLFERQANVPTQIIDSFFSVQPMTPDLTKIFPAIDPKYLKRNSSVMWNTPPRYSQMPKY